MRAGKRHGLSEGTRAIIKGPGWRVATMSVVGSNRAACPAATWAVSAMPRAVKRGGGAARALSRTMLASAVFKQAVAGMRSTMNETTG